MVVSKNLKKLRKNALFTQKQVADFLGIKYQQYQRYELGTYKLPITMLPKLKQLYHCTYDDILE